MEFSWDPLVLTFKLAILTTGILLVIGVPLSYWLASWESHAKYLVQTLVSMPLVLPPTVLGFYLLVAFNPGGPIGSFLVSAFDVRMVFTFQGLVAASVIYSLPFMVNPIQAGFQSLPVHLSEASYTLGKSRFRTFISILLPNIKPNVLTGAVMCFAHTVGEFGVILMIGGSIPGETRVASIAIYDEVEALNYQTANRYALVLFGITFLILFTVYLVNRKSPKTF